MSTAAMTHKDFVCCHQELKFPFSQDTEVGSFLDIIEWEARQKWNEFFVRKFLVWEKICSILDWENCLGEKKNWKRELRE